MRLLIYLLTINQPIHLQRLSIPKKTIHSPLFWRGAGGEALYSYNYDSRTETFRYSGDIDLHFVNTLRHHRQLVHIMRKIDLIIVHCAATPEGKDFTTEDIDRWHRQQGFSSIGYHFVVYRDGSVHTGRPIDQVGAHCRGRNSTSIGICYIGGLSADGKRPKDTRTDNQKKALKALLTLLKIRFPDAEIRGHRDYAAKACPSFDATFEYKDL